MKRWLAFAWGCLFALGLTIGGIARPTVILGHLDVFGDWDPTLLIALCAGSLVYAGFYHGAARFVPTADRTPRCVPRARKVDWRLLLGASIFGAGWGIAGLCPGAVLVSVAHPDGRASIFLVAMVAGMFVHGLAERLAAPSRSERPAARSQLSG